MPRTSVPWRRKSMPGGPWYSTVAGRKVFLAPGKASKAEAQKELDRVVRLEGQGDTSLPGGASTVAEVVRLYFGDRSEAVARGEMTAESLKGTFRFLRPFEAKFGKVAVAALKPGAVEAWVASRGTPGPRAPGRWGQTTRARATEMLKSCFRWAQRTGHVGANPLERMTGPKPLRREAVMTREQVDRLIGATPDQEYRDLVQALLWTGCRTNEVYTLTADRVDLEAGVWRVLDKNRRKTGAEFRTVYLNAAAIELSRRLVALHPEGPIFRNTRGRAWNRSSAGHRTRDYCERLGIGAEGVLYSMRHLFATDLLQIGTPPATVAQLMGHTSMNMVTRIYNQLKARTEHLRDAVNRARPGDQSVEKGIEEGC